MSFRLNTKQRKPFVGGTHAVEITFVGNFGKERSKKGSLFDTFHITYTHPYDASIQKTDKVWGIVYADSILSQLLEATKIEIDEYGNFDVMDFVGCHVEITVVQNGDYFNVTKVRSVQTTQPVRKVRVPMPSHSSGLSDVLGDLDDPSPNNLFDEDKEDVEDTSSTKSKSVHEESSVPMNESFELDL